MVRELVLIEMFEPVVEQWLELGEDRDGSSAGGCFAVAHGQRFGVSGEVDVCASEGCCFADAQAAPPQKGDARLLGYSKYSNGSQTDSTTYIYDALDRPTTEVETHAGATTTTTLRYVGDSDAVSQETLSGASSTVKKYGYAADGQRITLADGAKRYSYLFDPHDSVSLLIGQTNVVKESYGYLSYGASNAATTKTAAGFDNKTNPYRYAGKRFDTGSNTYDMGARRYAPATGRWLQVDGYSNAFDDLSLARDPLNANRYLFARANPINYIDIDGHFAIGPELDFVPHVAQS